MRRALATLAMLAVFALGTSGALAAKPAQAAGPDTLNLTTAWISIGCRIEQLTIYVYGMEHRYDPCPSEFVVNNPTVGTGAPCIWDVDDAYTTLDSSGRISVGQTVTESLCVIVDGTHSSSLDVGVRAKHDELVVRLDVTDGRSWLATPVRDGSEYAYRICTRAFVAGPHPAVPDSNGGTGTFLTYTLTVAAPTRGANDVGAMLDYGQGIYFVSGC